MQEMQAQTLGQEDPLGKRMARHSRILARRIPWTEEPGGLTVHGWQRIRHDWVTNTSLSRLPECSFFSIVKAQITPVSYIPLTCLLSSLVFQGDHGRGALCSHRGATALGVQETLPDSVTEWMCCLLSWEIPSLVALSSLAPFQNLLKGLPWALGIQ